MKGYEVNWDDILSVAVTALKQKDIIQYYHVYKMNCGKLRIRDLSHNRSISPLNNAIIVDFYIE